MDFIFSPVRHFQRMTALQKRLKQIQSTSVKAVGFTLLVLSND
ncbi:hypothetical protein JN10_1839 [Altererythrobacter ishigakiensis]|uniref:Uncharacterized protein n=1 Tax=Altererythrobacter ishigakiensis TaxID=476157 RepID=A0A562UX40_9SPHN|nr:hypothetical protein JN10_1839 [Altererythrobacter ishigakiensis]